MQKQVMHVIQRNKMTRNNIFADRIRIIYIMDDKSKIIFYYKKKYTSRRIFIVEKYVNFEHVTLKYGNFHQNKLSKNQRKSVTCSF